MPTYEYVCNNCGNKVEIFQSITDRPLRKCPACERNTLRRLIGAGAGIIFHGSGFYATDYRSEGYKRDAAKEKGGGSPGKPSTQDGNSSDRKKDGHGGNGKGA